MKMVTLYKTSSMQDPVVCKALAPYREAILSHLIPDLVSLTIEYFVERGRENGYEGFLVNGVKQGMWKNNAIKAEQNYVSDKLHGMCCRWYEIGQLWYEDTYVDGKLHGTCRQWYKNRQMQYERPYIDGEF